MSQSKKLNRVEIRSIFLQALQDGEYHSHDEVADFITAEMGLSDADRRVYAGDGYQSPLDNAINWIKGREFRFDFHLIEYNDAGTKFRLTNDGRKVLNACIDGPLTYAAIRRVVE